MSRWFLGLAGSLWLACAGATLGAEKIKLATLAPTGSSFHKSLLAMKDAWRKASNGGVDLVIYADGKLGGEADTVGLMSVNSIQAAMLTGVGLAEVEFGVAGLQNIPMGFRDLAEVDYACGKLEPMLEKRLLEKGFVVLFWSDAGWVRFFSKEPVTYPEDLKKLKLFTWAGNPEQVVIYKSGGFNPVPLETADIVPGLQTGLIEATPAPPVFALASQIDGRAPPHARTQLGPADRGLHRPPPGLGENSGRYPRKAARSRGRRRQGNQGQRTTRKRRIRCGDGETGAQGHPGHARNRSGLAG